MTQHSCPDCQDLCECLDGSISALDCLHCDPDLLDEDEPDETETEDDGWLD